MLSTKNNSKNYNIFQNNAALLEQYLKLQDHHLIIMPQNTNHAQLLNKMTKVKNKTILNLILLFSIFALLTAYFIQYVLGHQPCNLCLIERIPYILTIIIITLTLIFKKFEKICLIILALVFVSAMFISIYHFGIEQGFIKESLVCDLRNKSGSLTTEDLLKELKEKTISCKDVTFKIFGLSLATINSIISLILSIIITKIFLNYEKNK